MARKVIRKLCGWGPDCPAIELDDDGRVYVTGYRPGAAHTPDNEETVEVPGAVLPEVVDLDIADFDTWLEERLGAPGDMLRIQTLDRYGAEDTYVDAYHRGDPGPTDEDMAGWAARLDAHRLAGQTYRNLHVIDGPLSREMQMQFGWAYPFNARHGMDIRVLDVAEQPAAEFMRRNGDYWVIEHKHVAVCRYDADGRPLGLVEVDAGGAPGFRTAAEMAWELGTPFAEWWAAHPEYHQAARRAA